MLNKEYAFNESDLGLLTTLTNSMGVALEMPAYLMKRQRYLQMQNKELRN